MHQFTIYCFNDAYQTASILNGIVHFMGSGSWSTISATVLSVLVVMAVLRFQKVDILSYMTGIILPFILFVLFFATPTKLNLTDEMSNEVYTVDNIPFGVGFPLWISSLIEKGFVDIIDTYVTPPTMPKFKEIDYFGHARMMSQVSTTNLWNDPPLQQTISEYFKDCVLHLLANETLFPQQIKTTNNLLAAFQSSAPAIFTKVHTETGYSVMACASAYANISSRVSTKAASLFQTNTPFARLTPVFGARGQVSALANASISSIAGTMFTGQQDSSEALFVQNLFINSTRASIGEISPDLLAAMSIAEGQQFSSGVTAMMVYVKQLPKLRSIFKLVLLALFPVVGAFFLASSARPFLYWAGSLLWISLWLPAEAAVHAAYIAESIADLRATVSATGGYSLANNTPIVNWATETLALAGSVMLIVPVLTGMLIRWVFPQVGTAITGMLTGARGFGQTVSTASAGAVEASRKMVNGLEKDKFAEAAMDYGDRMANIRNWSKDHIRSHSDTYADPIWGKAPTQFNRGDAISLGFGDYTMSATSQISDVQSAQASLASARTQHEGLARSLAISALMSDAKNGGISNSLSVQGVATQSQQESINKNWDFISNSSWGKQLKADYGTEYAETVTFVAALAGALGGSLGGSLSEQDSLKIAQDLHNARSTSSPIKGKTGPVTTNTQTDNKGVGLASQQVGSSQVGADAKLGASLTSKEQRQDTARFSDSDAFSEAHDVGTKNQIGKNESLTKGFSKSQMAILTKVLGDNQVKATSYTDQFNKTYQAQQSFNAQKQRLDSISASLANGSGLQVKVQDVFGTMMGGGIQFLANSNLAVRSELARSGNIQNAAKEGYIDFRKAHTSALKTGNRNDWEKVFSTIDGLEAGHQFSGNRQGVEGARAMREIASIQLMQSQQAGSSLDALKFSLLNGQSVNYTGINPIVFSTSLGQLDSGVPEIEAKKQELLEKQPGNEIGPAPVLSHRQENELRYPRPLTVSEAEYQDLLKAYPVDWGKMDKHNGTLYRSLTPTQRFTHHKIREGNYNIFGDTPLGREFDKMDQQLIEEKGKIGEDQLKALDKHQQNAKKVMRGGPMGKAREFLLK